MRFQKAIWLAVILLLLGCAHREDAEESGIPAYLVRITAGEVSGSGILYNVDEGNLNVLTAAHMAESTAAVGGALTLSFCDGWEVASTDMAISKLSDLAVVKVPIGSISAEHLERYQCAETDKESFDALHPEDSCVAVGIGAAEGVLKHEGSILEPWIYMEDYSQYMIWAKAEIRPGMSGGGLFDDNGYLIGILSGGSEDGESAAVPLSLVWQFLMSY